MGGAKERLRALYDPNHFQGLFGIWAEKLSSLLTEAENGSREVLHWRHPPDFVKEVEATLTRRQATDYSQRNLDEFQSLFREVMQDFTSSVTALHSPRYMAHQVPPPLPMSGLLDGASAVTNQASGLYEINPLTSAVERVLTRRLCQKVGWDDTSDGFITHGGSIANLTALLSARNLKYGRSWDEGLSGHQGKTPVVLTGADTHYSVARAAGIMGIGNNRVLKVKLDSQRRMRGEALVSAIAEAERNGCEVLAVVASAGTTPVGAYDVLNEIADVTEKRGLWLHVDGAHGASALFSQAHRDKLSGLERVDSLTWDAHKLLFVPSLTTFILFKKSAHSYAAFHQEAPYLFDRDAEDMRPYDPSYRTLECTRRAQGLPLWAVWSMYGEKVFEDLVDTCYANARTFHEMLKNSSDFEVLNEPQSNILCFRYLPKMIQNSNEEKVSQFQQALRKTLMETGHFYITRTRLDQRSVLRVTLMNPLTEVAHLEELLGHIRQLASRPPFLL